MSLVARFLEKNDIPTVIVGSALDVVEHCGVPRFLFTDFPLGNPSGRPWDKEMQRKIVKMALNLLETSDSPRTTVKAPFKWDWDAGWRSRYNSIFPGDEERLFLLGEERRKKRTELAMREY